MLQGLDAPKRETLIKNAAQAYGRAKTGLPDEWVYSCYHGKLQSKLGESCTVMIVPDIEYHHQPLKDFSCMVLLRPLQCIPECPAPPCSGLPPEQWLPSMAKAVQLSILHTGGMLEPFYQLHTQRLKLLLFNEAPTVLCLTTIARQVVFLEQYKMLHEAPYFHNTPVPQIRAGGYQNGCFCELTPSPSKRPSLARIAYLRSALQVLLCGRDG